jgi:hypothetical protein
MRTSPAARYSGVFLLSLSLGGCSLVFVNGPPRGHQDVESFECTENWAVPVLDAAAGGAWLVYAVQAHGYRNASEESVRAWRLGYATIAGVSAAIGFNRVSKCRAARGDLTRRLLDTLQQTRSTDWVVRLGPTR